MNLGKYAPCLDLLYNDRMEIYRYDDFVDENNVTQTMLSDTPIYSDIPCLMTTKQDDIPETSDPSYNEYEVLGAVFCKHTWDIQKGDIIRIERFDNGVKYAEFRGSASHPSTNPMCQKVLLLGKRKAVQHGI